MPSLPDRVRIIIVGGGVVGCSLAYHLAKRGAGTDVLLLERHRLTAGTTWHAAGLVGQLRATQNLTRLAQYTAGLYRGLEAETGQPTGFRESGSLAVATTGARFEELRRGASMARRFGLEVQVLGPSDAAAVWPLMEARDVVGGVYLPRDGYVSPIDVTQALAKGARIGGVRIEEGVSVTAILTDGGRASGVMTDQGPVRADAVVNCAGMWAHGLAASVGVTVPLHAAEHFYVVTEAIPGLPPNLPVLRDPDLCTYVKPEPGRLLVGWFETKAKPWGTGGVPSGFSFGHLPDDMEHVAPLLEATSRRLPILGRTGIRLFFNGPESFTPDDRYLLGEAPELPGFYVAAGFNSIGIQSAGGAGRVLADWILDGHPPMDLWDVAVRRALPFQRNARYLRDRTVETLGLLYAVHWPFRQPETSRGVRRSPIHDRLAAAGACFGEAAGWERANWFAPPGARPEYEYSYGRQNWFAASAEEHRAVRTAAGLFDQTSFAQFVVEGADAEAALNRICGNDVAVPPGRVVYTQWLNERGGIEADLTITRESETRFRVVTAAATQTRDFAWLRKHLPPDARVAAWDASSAYATLSVMGPSSRQILSALTPEDLSNAAFPFATAREIDLAYARVWATRITYVGELGWELHMPVEYAPGVFEALMEAGAPHGLRLAGYHALNSLRIEKAYRHWGHDITDEDDPIQAGLGFAVAWDKPGGFIGQRALLARRGGKLTRRLAAFILDDPAPLLYHNEPIWRDGAMVGHITSGMFGHTVGRAIGLGYVGCDDGVDAAFVNAGRYEIEVACERFAARVTLKPPYDSAGARIRS
jgi:glycine cleavage system aminomethyltransferase T/glycine/D-amino acid oxidase-like deaminating enzyme